MMQKSDQSHAQQIARAALDFAQRATGRLSSSVAVVLSGDTVVITLHGTLSLAECGLAKGEEGAAALRELRRQLFAIASEPLRQEIRQITGIEVCETTAEVETSTGTAVQVFSLACAVPGSAWSGSNPGALAAADDAKGEL